VIEDFLTEEESLNRYNRDKIVPKSSRISSQKFIHFIRLMKPAAVIIMKKPCVGEGGGVKVACRVQKPSHLWRERDGLVKTHAPPRHKSAGRGRVWAPSPCQPTAVRPTAQSCPALDPCDDFEFFDPNSVQMDGVVDWGWSNESPFATVESLGLTLDGAAWLH
jgi:hypothetical protein